MKLKILSGLILSMGLQAQAFMPGEKVLDISRGVFAKIVDENRNGTFAIQHTTGPLAQTVLEGFSSDQLGAVTGRIKNISVGDIVFDNYRKSDALVVALGGDNKFVIRHLTGSYAGKLLPGYSVDYLKAEFETASTMKLETELKSKKTEVKATVAAAVVVVEKVAKEVVPAAQEVKAAVTTQKSANKTQEVAPAVVNKSATQEREELLPVIKNDFKNKKAAVFNMLLKRSLEE